ncbi:cysteine-rich repeat secretory protein 38-like isoform X2 [Hibiscus syriacus]|uniref:cysteine-rich repeat secretory protein 38-like isoform X2 n=1 Tax=Hibiscus syriacus TaxID=106335 RepID=UPI0019225F02|nr:cysteine-rich repeat secretory protein 38-like isoform X2 [Hibiscus syriacus]
MGTSTFLMFLCSLVLSLAAVVLSKHPAVDVYLERRCNEASGNYSANSAYEANLNSIISRFSTSTEFNYGFFNLSAGESSRDKVNSVALCRGDMNQADCKTCLNYTATELKRFCPFNKAATAWSELCLVRYANRDLYGLLENDPRICVFNPRNPSYPDQFNDALSDLLDDLRNEAAAAGPVRKYAAGNASAGGNHERVYATMQCTPDMDQLNCDTCLAFAQSELEKCCYGRIGCRVLRPNCVLRFESNPFYNETAVPLPSPQPSPSGGKSPTVIIVIASVVGVLILVFISMCMLMRRRRNKPVSANVETAPVDSEMSGIDPLQSPLIE